MSIFLKVLSLALVFSSSDIDDIFNNKSSAAGHF
jgi:hypothetical protein